LVNWDRENRPAPLPGSEILAQLDLKAAKLNLHLEPKNIKIENWDWKVIIDIQYSYEVRLFPRLSFNLRFHPRAETQPLMAVDNY
jgi:hypothetical protein